MKHKVKGSPTYGAAIGFHVLNGFLDVPLELILELWALLNCIKKKEEGQNQVRMTKMISERFLMNR